MKSINPCDGSEITSYEEFGETTTDELTDRSARAFREWSRTSFEHRSALMKRAAGVLRDKKEDYDFSIMDIKEAAQAAAPRSAGVKMPADQAERVVEGARNLSPYLGKRMRAVKLMDKSVFVRELMPQDLKIEIEHLSRDEAMKVAHYLSAIVGKAHSRQMDVETRKQWQTELQRNRSAVRLKG